MVVSALSCSQSARAQDQQPPEPPPLAESLTGEAKEAYDAAREAFDQHRYQAALERFRRAHALSGDARLYWNMAVCEKSLGRFTKVVKTIQRYIAESGDKLSDKERERAAAVEAAARQRLRPLRISTKPATSEVWIDGELVGTTPLPIDAAIDPGSHVIAIKRTGFEPVEHAVTVASQPEVTLDVTLQPIVPPGTIDVIAAPGDTIVIDGVLVGVGNYRGPLARGAHTLRVAAAGKKTHQVDVAVEPGTNKRVVVRLERAGLSPRAIGLIAGGAVTVTVATIVTAALLTRKSVEVPVGTMPPGSVDLGVRGWAVWTW
jgi:hypothetical protein